MKAPFCAKRFLISRFSLTEAFESVRGCFKEVKPYLLADIVVQHRSPLSKRTYILNKLKHFSGHFSRKGYYGLDYVVGVSPNRVLKNVYKVCFQREVYRKFLGKGVKGKPFFIIFKKMSLTF